MTELSRRHFLKQSAKLAALMGLGSTAAPRIAAALERLAAGDAPVIWLQGQSCSGCSVSLLNSEDPGPAQILTEYISLLFHSTLSTATGETGMEIVDRALGEGGFYLVVEGSMPAGMPDACIMGGVPVTDLVERAAKKAKAVIAIGACASVGGIPAAENNPTGAVSVPEFFQQKGIGTPTITLPGCPCHPDWMVGTLVHVLEFGLPPLDAMGRPTMFYSKLVHDQCPRFSDYERENFATTFSEDGCLFKLGCLGAKTHADCSLRLWNSRTNFCINAGAPCIGCAWKDFARQQDFPFYTKEGAAQAREG